jgi:hypothetical protein
MLERSDLQQCLHSAAPSWVMANRGVTAGPAVRTGAELICQAEAAGLGGHDLPRVWRLVSPYSCTQRAEWEQRASLLSYTTEQADQLELLAVLQGNTAPAHPPVTILRSTEPKGTFRVTYETITAESAECGDYADMRLAQLARYSRG